MSDVQTAAKRGDSTIAFPCAFCRRGRGSRARRRDAGCQLPRTLLPRRRQALKSVARSICHHASRAGYAIERCKHPVQGQNRASRADRKRARGLAARIDRYEFLPAAATAA